MHASEASRCPPLSTTSSQALYRLRRLFYALHQKSPRAHSAAPPFQIEPAPLGFDSVLVSSLKLTVSAKKQHIRLGVLLLYVKVGTRTVGLISKPPPYICGREAASAFM